MDILIPLVCIFLLAAIFLAFIARSQKNITPQEKKYILNHLKKIEKLPYSQKIFELDKLLDYTLKCKKYTGTLGEKMKKANPIFFNANTAWHAHKMRNKMAHEVGYEPSDKEIKKSCQILEKQIRLFL